MGSTCCSSDRPKYVIDTTSFRRNPDWTDAVGKTNLTGVRYLHAENPDLINEPVDNMGHKAIHIAVQKKHGELLLYLLQNGSDINAIGGKTANTALHEATLKKDMKAVRLLFSYGIDDQITNTKGSRAIDLLSKSLKREFLKAKQYKNKHREQLNQQSFKRSTAGDITIAGMSLKTNTEKIKKYVHQQDHEVNFYKNKKKEIEDREMPLTAFGEACGVDIDELAMTLQKMPNAGKQWQKWAKAASVSRQTEIFKILYGLTVAALKKNPRSKKPPP